MNWKGFEGYRVSFLGVKKPESDVGHPPLSSAEVNEGVQLDLCSPSGLSWPVLGWTLPWHTSVCVRSRRTQVGSITKTSQWMLCGEVWHCFVRITRDKWVEFLGARRIFIVKLAGIYSNLKALSFKEVTPCILEILTDIWRESGASVSQL